MTNLLKAATLFAKLAGEKDPKAKVRNRGDYVFPAEHPKVKDNKDHFPTTSESQARNALARASQYSKVPPWYSGTLQSLVSAVQRKVRSKYKGIEVTDFKQALIAKTHLRSSLGRPKWLRGIGVGLDDTGYFVKINVNTITSEIRNAVPRQVNQVSVKLDAVGEIVAQ